MEMARDQLDTHSNTGTRFANGRKGCRSRYDAPAR